MTASDQQPCPGARPRDPRSVEASAGPLAVQALRRAVQVGIDPWRVALALAIPLDDVPGLIAEVGPSDAARPPAPRDLRDTEPEPVGALARPNATARPR